MNPLLAQFIVEAREHVSATTDGLLALERQTDDANLLNGVFRSVHTLKGSSGLFDFPALTSVLHAGEDLLVALRERRLVVDPAMLDQVLAALDLVSNWLDAIEDGGNLPHDAAERGGPVATALRGWLTAPIPDPGLSPRPAGMAADNVIPLHPAPPVWLAKTPEAALLGAVEYAVANGMPVVAVAYRPDAQCFFKGDDPLALMRQLPDILYLGLEEPEPWPGLGEYDPFSCRVGFRVISGAPKTEVQHLLRYVADQAEVVELHTGDLLCLVGAPSGESAVRAFAVGAMAQLQRGHRGAVRESAAAMLRSIESDSGDVPALRWLARLAANDMVGEPVLECLLTALAEGSAPVPPDAMDDAPANGRPALSEPVIRLLRAQLDLLGTPCDRIELAGRIGSAAKVAGNALRHDGRVEQAEAVVNAGWAAVEAADAATLIACIGQVLAEAPGATDLIPTADGTPPGRIAPDPATAVLTPGRGPAAAAGEESHERASTVLRVDQSRIDALMNLIGELVVAKNGLPFLARRAETVYGSREMAREVKEQYAVIDRIAVDLRNSIMQVRMLPVSTVFQRFPRLVRDLSRKLGKRVDLVIEGEDTQADKTVIESLFEPLLHLVRNSLDHGIETDRDAAGKPPVARLTLAATRDNDQVIIRVIDDGRGIDPAVMRHKAVERGIIDEEQAARMGNGEAVRLIFAAGFSTAAEVTDVSGRGVGMDAVRTAVEKAGGRIDVSSEVGGGTTISLHLPLSMAVTRVMTVSVSGRQFGIAMDAISETVRIPRGDIVAIKDREAFVLRNRIIPLFHLDRLLDLPFRADSEEVAVLVVQVDKQTVGLAIDAFGEGMEVIVKPLDGPLENTSEYLGTALLGDGRVLLVLDLKEIVQ
ncbi:chemotaxis protein CheA [Azospirillum halopraeferens]|uniref:chemotaxis protein CheA n=1 Tax=Azospirillum halopraeferens TaxID=34010 RepID=UPI0004230D09|nr:chemotaxis protein CheA [Azospirillum halopraeferens]